MTREISLTKGKVALVDDDKWEWLSQWRWQISTWGYATRKGRNEGKSTIMMHRAIMNPPDDMWIDHINFCRTDNRVENLRIVTPQQSQAHKPPSKKCATGYRGVVIRNHGNNKKYHAFLGNTCLGCYTTAALAAKAYNDAAQAAYGEYAYLNPIDPAELQVTPTALPRRSNTSGIIGAQPFTNKRGDTVWRAQIWDGTKSLHLGTFSSPDEAGQAYDAARLRLPSKHPIVLNFPPTGE